jgi:hypothetical protein
MVILPRRVGTQALKITARESVNRIGLSIKHQTAIKLRIPRRQTVAPVAAAAISEDETNLGMVRTPADGLPLTEADCPSTLVRSTSMTARNPSEEPLAGKPHDGILGGANASNGLATRHLFNIVRYRSKCRRVPRGHRPAKLLNEKSPDFCVELV